MKNEPQGSRRISTPEANQDQACAGKPFGSKWRSWNESGPLCRPTGRGYLFETSPARVGLGSTRVHQLVTSPQADSVEHALSVFHRSSSSKAVDCADIERLSTVGALNKPVSRNCQRYSTSELANLTPRNQARTRDKMKHAAISPSVMRSAE